MTEKDTNISEYLGISDTWEYLEVTVFCKKAVTEFHLIFVKEMLVFLC
jgi:hypothetical protein